ncbi:MULTISPECIES: MarR family winged helix-turn-helix transcriptional regulator [Prauserella salsuginis group]|uniref:DNA-binding MarR family transcriptional regulator n=2 Tax=Prauserella salsuginis group TaxID=2893672 RepID=A0A839XH17_9PSEU|nr:MULTISPECIES: MarR family transcriptional regulator [Prauserella salsuginis group]MBB3662580.1 DNA-binding MarR family transcriptional regulator [Prauserella sediminis]MCR3720286.1 DNA-binding transcriptional regulator, MarR family [Prauserella flava]MCR3734006.1 DNA-binding transcriptional regulator, MarR family [Prauserella salsuginis]
MADAAERNSRAPASEPAETGGVSAAAGTVPTGQSSEPDVAGPAVLDALRALHASHDVLLERVAERYGIGRNDLRCLEILEREGPMRPQHLAERSRLSPAAITKVADRLVRCGFVVRQTDEADRRGYVLRVSTGHGRLRASTWDAVRADATAALGELSPAEAALLVRIAAALTDINTRHAERLEGPT